MSLLTAPIAKKIAIFSLEFTLTLDKTPQIKLARFSIPNLDLSEKIGKEDVK